MSIIERAMERLDQTRRGQQGSARSVAAVQRPVAGTVKPVHRLNFAALERLGCLTPQSVQSKQAEEYRLLKRMLLVTALGKGSARVDRGNLIMVTSALPGEGKTFTALNLAMSMAMELDSTVLLADSDVLQPSLTEIMDLKDRPGLIDGLLDPTMNLGDAIVSTDVPRLKLLPAGRADSLSTELLSSDHMRRLATQVSKRYADRVVLFDTPPVLAASQAGVLADLVGQIVIVVEEGGTPVQAIKSAVAQLNRNKPVWLVLNKGRTVRGDYLAGWYDGTYGP